MLNAIPSVKRGLGVVLGGACCASLLFATTALAASNHASAKKFLSVNAGSKTATLKVIGEYNSSNNGYNFDGFSSGKMIVTIPLGWTVKVKCSDAATAAVNHSCVITKGLNATKPAFTGAGVKNPTAGLTPGSSATFSFVANKTGTYRINCLVPGHAVAGSWDYLKVVAGGSPSISP
jgi:Sulfocyanin (SoxE) domain